jgi:hypothetical protein
MERKVGMSVPGPWLAEQLHLHWAGMEGEFHGPDGTLIARDPSVRAPGPQVLLVREAALREFLDIAGYEIIWTILGCKETVGRYTDIPDQLHLNGSFRYHEGEIEGGVRATYHAYPSRTK